VAKRIESGALDTVDKALGLAGAGGAPLTELDDGLVQQVLVVNELTRRSLAPGDTGGIYRAVMRNVSSGADGIISTWTPYAATAGLIVSPYTNPVPDTLDVWLLSASVNRISGSGSSVSGLLIQNIRQAFGVNQAGSSTVSNPRIPLALWDDAFNADVIFQATSGQVPWKRLIFRVPRLGEASGPVQLIFATESSATSEWECNILFGLFPVALGQDALG